MIIDIPPTGGGGLRILQRTVLAAPATSVIFSGLSANDGECYVVLCQGVGGTGIVASGDVLLQPNGVVGTNQACQDLQGGANFNLGNLHAGSFSLAGVNFHFRAELDIQATLTGGHGFRSQGSFTTTGAVLTQELEAGRWLDTAEITSLVVTASTASALGTGTRVVLYAWR